MPPIPPPRTSQALKRRLPPPPKATANSGSAADGSDGGWMASSQDAAGGGSGGDGYLTPAEYVAKDEILKVKGGGRLSGAPWFWLRSWCVYRLGVWGGWGDGRWVGCQQRLGGERPGPSWGAARGLPGGEGEGILTPAEHVARDGASTVRGAGDGRGSLELRLAMRPLAPWALLVVVLVHAQRVWRVRCGWSFACAFWSPGRVNAPAARPGLPCVPVGGFYRVWG